MLQVSVRRELQVTTHHIEQGLSRMLAICGVQSLLRYAQIGAGDQRARQHGDAYKCTALLSNNRRLTDHPLAVVVVVEVLDLLHRSSN